MGRNQPKRFEVSRGEYYNGRTKNITTGEQKIDEDVNGMKRLRVGNLHSNGEEAQTRGDQIIMRFHRVRMT